MEFSKLRYRICSRCPVRFDYDEARLRFLPVPGFPATVVDEFKARAADYGLTASEMQEVISKVVQAESIADGFSPITTVLTGRLRNFDRVRIVHGGGQRLDLVLIPGVAGRHSDSEACFTVSDDTTGHLRPCDLLRPLNFVWQEGAEAIFRVLRNGEPYPAPTHLFRIRSIEWLEKAATSTFSLIDRQAVQKGCLTSVYAWQADVCNGRAFFRQEALTADARAAFRLDPAALAFSLNPEFDTALYKHEAQTYLDALKPACDYEEAAEDDERFTTVRRGSMRLHNFDNRQYVLEVVGKAYVKL